MVSFDFIQLGFILDQVRQPHWTDFSKLKFILSNLLPCYIGYLRITDFGIARVWREENAQDTSGTPGYMAPEVMCRQNHTCSVDFFAVGVMAYECMFGRVRISVDILSYLLSSNLVKFVATLCWKVQERDT